SRKSQGLTAMTATPTGTLTKKIHGQLNALVKTPPSNTPTAPPLPATAPQIPSARLRSRPSSKVVVRIDSAAGDIIEAPRPCRQRKAIREPSDQASPLSSELTVNKDRPAMNRRRRPKRSARRPPSRRNPPKKIEYAVMTHCRLS